MHKKQIVKTRRLDIRIFDHEHLGQLYLIFSDADVMRTKKNIGLYAENVPKNHK